MIAMQYKFTLPERFDMNIIKQRIEQNAHKLNGFPHLGFKAYLFQEQNSDDAYQQENQYTPFYFWNSSEGMKAFITTEAYNILEHDFGRPEILTYLPFVHRLTDKLKGSRYVWAYQENISRETDINVLLAQQETLVDQFSHPDMTAYIVTLDTIDWSVHTWLFFSSVVKRNAIPQLNNNERIELSSYQVGYVAE